MSEEMRRVYDFVVFSLGVAISVLAVVLAFTAFSPDSGPHRGGIILGPALVVMGIIVGGAITGVALSRKITPGWGWPGPIVLGLAWMGGVTTVIVVYGKHVAPSVFDASFVIGTYRTVLGFGAVLLVATQLASHLLGRRSSSE